MYDDGVIGLENVGGQYIQASMVQMEAETAIIAVNVMALVREVSGICHTCIDL